MWMDMNALCRIDFPGIHAHCFLQGVLIVEYISTGVNHRAAPSSVNRRQLVAKEIRTIMSVPNV